MYIFKDLLETSVSLKNAPLVLSKTHFIQKSTIDKPGRPKVFAIDLDDRPCYTAIFSTRYRISYSIYTAIRSDPI